MTTLAGDTVSEGMHALPFLTASFGVGTTAFKSFEKVPQGHVAFRTHNGVARKQEDSRLPWGKKAGTLYKMYRPGLHLKIPFTHGFDSVSLQDRTTELQAIAIDTKAERQHQIRSSITWGVVRERDEAGNVIDYGVDYKELVFRALYEVKNEQELMEAVAGVCVTGLRQAMLEMEEPRTADPSDVQTSLVKFSGESLLTYGVELRRLNLYDTAYTSPDVLGHKLAGSTDGAWIAAAVAETPPNLRGIAGGYQA